MSSGFDPSTVDLATKTNWCNAQLSTCRNICGTTSTNKCTPDSLVWICSCSAGPTPDFETIEDTVPFFECQEEKSQCISSSSNDLAAQQLCASRCNNFTPTAQVSLAPATSSTGSSATTPPPSTTLSSTVISSPAGGGGPQTIVQTIISTATPSTQANASDGPRPSSNAWIAGAAVGPVVGLFVIATIIWLCLRRRKKSRNDNVAVRNEPSAEKQNEPELSAGERADRHELDPQRHPQEMWAGHASQWQNKEKPQYHYAQDNSFPMDPQEMPVESYTHRT